MIRITSLTAAYIAKKLSNRGFNVSGISGDKRLANLANLSKVGVNPVKLNLISLNPADSRQVLSSLAANRHDCIINLAGQASVGLSFEQPA